MIWEMISVGKLGALGDGYIDTDGTDLVYGLAGHSHIAMVDCHAISHLFVYIVTNKNAQNTHKLNVKGLCTKNGGAERFVKKF